MARLDRLAPIKEIAQIGATIGREFPFDLLEAVSPIQGVALQDALGQLMAAGLIFGHRTPSEVTYAFKHALVQETAYATLLKRAAGTSCISGSPKAFAIDFQSAPNASRGS